MSMILTLTTVSDATIDRLLAHPSLIHHLLAWPDAPFTPAPRPSLLRRLLGSRASSERPNLNLSDDEGVRCDLDKSWHGIHFLLTGTAWEGEMPQAFLLLGGEVIGDEDVGYGPARALHPVEVASVAASLQSVSTSTLRDRFDPKHMIEQEIYPAIWDRDPSEDDTLGYLLEYFDDLKSSVSAASEKRMGLVIDLS